MSGDRKRRSACGRGQRNKLTHSAGVLSGAAAPEVPKELLAQLKAPGRMFIPVGTTSQAVWQIDRDERGELSRQKLYGVRYVPCVLYDFMRCVERSLTRRVGCCSLTDPESQYPSRRGVQQAFGD